jgi:hypothetical protein
MLLVTIPSLWLSLLDVRAQAPQAGPSPAAEPTGRTAGQTVASDKPLPTLAELLKRYGDAVGGLEKASQFTTRKMHGLYQSEDSSIFFGIDILQKAPNKTYMKIALPQDMFIHEVCDGKSAWLEDPRGGVHEYTGAALQDRIRRADFYGSASGLLLKLTGKVTGTAAVGTHTAYVVQTAPRENLVENSYFDADSGLLIREDSILTTPGGAERVETYFDDYREVDGIRVPFRTRHVEKGSIFSIRLIQVKHNVPVDDGLFVKPASSTP